MKGVVYDGHLLADPNLKYGGEIRIEGHLYVGYAFVDANIKPTEKNLGATEKILDTYYLFRLQWFLNTAK